jgi:ElaB/YqjD/DUF883 family membrane-anchored ribosome-binding protein
MSDRNKTKTHGGSQTAEELIQNIQALMAEVESVIATGANGDIATAATSKFQDLKDRFSDATEQMQGYYQTARKKVVSGARAADETIRSHPYESLAVALGVGVLLGALLRRRE